MELAKWKGPLTRIPRPSPPSADLGLAESPRNAEPQAPSSPAELEPTFGHIPGEPSDGQSLRTLECH